MHCYTLPTQREHTCCQEGRQGNPRLRAQKIRGAYKTMLCSVNTHSTLQVSVRLTHLPDCKANVPLKGEIYRNRTRICHGSAKAWNLERRRSIEIPYFPVQLLQNLVVWSTSAEHLVVDYTHTLRRKPVLPQLDSSNRSQHVIDLKAQAVSQLISSSPFSSLVDS